MLDDLIIYQKTYDFLLWLYPVVNKFPKAQRFVLGQRIENKTLDLIHSIIFSNAERDKSALLKKASVELDELRTLIRLAKDLRFVNVKQYGVAAAEVDNALDNKIAILLALEVALGVGYASFAFNNLENFQLTVAILGLIVLCASIILLLIAQWPSTYRYMSSITDLMQNYLDKPEEELILWIIGCGRKAIDENKKRRKTKKRLNKVALTLLVASFVLLVSAKI
jgi:hypothetical protein